MKKIKALVLLQLKTILKQPAVLLVFAGLPILGSLFLIYALQPIFDREAYVEPFHVALADKDDSLETRAIIHQLASSEEFSRVVEFIRTSESEGLELLENNEAAAMAVIPENFSEDLRIGKNTPVQVVGNPQRPLQYQLFLAVMESGADLISAAQSGVNTVHFFLRDEIDSQSLNQEVQQAIIDFTFTSLGRNQIFATETLSETGIFTLEEYYLAAAATALTLITGFLLLILMRNDFSHSMNKRLLLAGCTPGVKVTADFLTSFLVLAAQLTVFIGGYFLIVDNSLGNNLLSFVTAASLGAAVTAMFFTLLSSFSLGQFAEAVIGISVLFVLLLLGGAVLPLAFFPEWAEDTGSYTFTYWMREGLMATAFFGDEETIRSSTAVMAGFTALFFTGAWINERRKAGR
ncbi:ABC transporter permease [Evansella clarkii]|uniref:ABC transporter permease n=1 Tax=Evansella clarkii TaxID=79879 RepID=UPI000B43ED41|nr:ABC transporter permease [Evansella clarkii]